MNKSSVKESFLIPMGNECKCLAIFDGECVCAALCLAYKCSKTNFFPIVYIFTSQESYGQQMFYIAHWDSISLASIDSKLSIW